MIKCHREYEEAVSEYAIDLYFWGVHAALVDVSEIDEIQKLFDARIEELRRKLYELDEWVTGRQPVLVHSCDDTVRTPRKGKCMPVESSITKYVENRPAGIFDQEETQPLTNMYYDDRAIYADKSRRKAREHLRELLNAESDEFMNACLGSEEE
jgi:hypothetical protein